MSNTVLQQDNDYTTESKLLQLIVKNEGSVMGLLESIFNEPIDIECLGQGFNHSTQEWSDVAKDENVLVRAVFLKGMETGNRYAYASSTIRTDYLERDVIDLLLEGKIGIGNIIKQCQLETYREILSNKLVYNRLIHSVFPDEKSITEKQYLIYVHKTPVMLIKEYYPHSFYQGELE